MWLTGYYRKIVSGRAFISGTHHCLPEKSYSKKETIPWLLASLRSGIAVWNPLYQGILKQYGFPDKLVERAIAMGALAWNHSLRP
jgi:hypothetical protein